MLPLFLMAALGCAGDKGGGDTSSVTPDTEDVDNDGYASDEDCDDGDPQVNPGASELCDNIDNNCDGSIDEGVTTTFYADTDEDGFGSASLSTEACEAPSGYVSVPNDCDDSDEDTFPGAPERCDEADNDCDGDVDEEVLFEWYTDADGDGYGDPDTAYEVCDPPPGYVSDDTDCDDLNATAYPGAAEVCDEADNDCDALVDEDVTTTYYQDADDDSYGLSDVTTEACERPTGYAARAGDCDDGDEDISPVQVELCDEIDNNCDGVTDEDTAADAATWYADDDRDGYGDSSDSDVSCAQPSGYVSDATDCDDTDAGANPGAAEVCDDADNDCDGEADEDSATDAATWYADSDGDGYGSASSTTACEMPSGFADNSDDCNDSEASANPGEAEVCDDIDNDCDGNTDEGVTTTYYLDADGDGYGRSGFSTEACAAPSGYVSDSTDCDDSDGASNPAGAEVCDEADNDCDGSTDEGVTTTYYVDADGDGYGDSSRSAEGCSVSSGYSADSSDCDDLDADSYPGAAEVCDEADNDCDGSTDEGVTTTYYADSDGDGYGDPDTTDDGCTAPGGYVSDSTDCDDGDGDISPDAEEACDDVDNDCDGTADNEEDVLGDGEACAGTDCQDILDYRADADDGAYWVDPDSSGDSVEVYCDMTTDDGGWTLVMKQASGSGYGSDLSVGVWDGWHTSGEVMNEDDVTLDDDNMVNAAYSRMTATDLRLTASSTWLDTSSGAWTYTINDTPFDALSDANGNTVGNLGTTETTAWSSASFTDATWTSTTTGYGLCWRSGPWFNQTSYEYTYGGVKWGWLFNNECYSSTTDTAEGLGCCGNSSWYRESSWTLYLWAR